MQRPFRLGVQLQNLPPADWAERLHRLEAWGYDPIFWPDHFGPQWEPVAALAAAAAVTQRLKVGSLVYGVDYRHPVVLAKAAATIQLLSGGPHEFGLGAGWMESDYREGGMPYACAGQRIERLEEALRVIRSLWSEDSTSFAGKHYNVHILCEKPFALNTHHAIAMTKKAQKNHCLLMVSSKYLYADDIIKTKSIVESGVLGDIIHLENNFCVKMDMRNRWNSKREIAGGGVLVGKGSDSADIVNYLLVPIVEVRADEGKRVQGLDVEDAACRYFRTHADAMGVANLSWSYSKDPESYMNIFGTEGSISLGWKCSKYRHCCSVWCWW